MAMTLISISTPIHGSLLKVRFLNSFISLSFSIAHVSLLFLIVHVESVTPLNSIKKHLNGEGKVPSIVAVIKSCTPNGFGDMTVTLKVLFYSFFNSIQYASDSRV
jgi:hypothetical protein